MVSFIDFYFQVSSKFTDLLAKLRLMFPIFTHVMLRDTHSEPGLPVVALHATRTNLHSSRVAYVRVWPYPPPVFPRGEGTATRRLIACHA